MPVRTVGRPGSPRGRDRAPRSASRSRAGAREGGVAWARMRARRRRPSPARQRGSIRRRRKERRPRRRPAGTREGAGGKRRRSAGLGRAGPGSVRFGGTGRAPARRGGPSPRRRFPAPPRSPPRPRSAPRRAARAAAAPPAAPGCPAERLAALRRGVGPSRRSLSSPFGADRFVSRCSLCQPGGAGSGALRGRVSVGPCGPAASRSGLGATRSVRAPLAAGAFRGGAASETYRDRELAWITGERGNRRSLTRSVCEAERSTSGLLRSTSASAAPVASGTLPGQHGRAKGRLPPIKLTGIPEPCCDLLTRLLVAVSASERLPPSLGSQRENVPGKRRWCSAPRTARVRVRSPCWEHLCVGSHRVCKRCVCVCVFLQGKPGSEQRLFLPLASCCHCLTSVLC